MDILNVMRCSGLGNEVCGSQKMKPDSDHEGVYNANEVSV